LAWIVERIHPSGAVPPPPDPLAGVDLTAVAKERAVARGKHLLDARYGCRECHGRDLSGGVMVDAPPIGKILGPNLTGGRGGVVAHYTMADWDRIVRHGVKPNGAGTMMPAEDHFLISDRELSDIVTYIRALPPVDNVVPAPVYGPLGKFLIARGEVRIAAELVKDHQAPHGALPPPEAPTVAFGRHLAAVCTGCHGPTLAGGKIPGGDPSWPAASNLTPHAEGLAGDTEEKFTERFRKGLRRDGQPMAPPMSLMVSYASNMTDTEVKALWTYLASLPATATPK
jgi:mono/diheme cytochrome c family protein